MKTLLTLTLAAALALPTAAGAQTRYGLYPATPGTFSPSERYVIEQRGMAPPTIERARPNESLMRPQYEFRPVPETYNHSRIQPPPTWGVPSYGSQPQPRWGR